MGYHTRRTRVTISINPTKTRTLLATSPRAVGCSVQWGAACRSDDIRHRGEPWPGRSGWTSGRERGRGRGRPDLHTLDGFEWGDVHAIPRLSHKARVGWGPSYRRNAGIREPPHLRVQVLVIVPELALRVDELRDPPLETMDLPRVGGGG